MKTNITLTLFGSCLLSLAGLQPVLAQDATSDTAANANANTLAETVSEDIQGKVKSQTITVTDSMGTLEEQRVQSMYSEIRYVPKGGTEGYNLIEATGSNGTVNSEHDNTDDMKIPSWNLFSW